MTRSILRVGLGALAALPSAVIALGLGPVEVRSALDQPLNARIPVLAAKPGELDELAAGLASREHFATVGVERSPVLSRLEFELVRPGGQRPYIEVRSSAPIREPLLDMLVEVNWPGGTLLREYSLFLDPPGRPFRYAQSSPSITVGSSRADDPETSRTSQAPRGDSVAYDGSSYGPVKSGETLWEIAKTVRPDQSVTIQQMMLAILDSNPESFRAGNVNSLNRGAMLQVPSREEALARTRQEAVAEAGRQWADWQARPTAQASVASAKTAPSTPADEASATQQATSDAVSPVAEVRLVPTEGGYSGEAPPGDAGATAGAAHRDAQGAAGAPGISEGKQALVRVQNNGGLGLKLAGIDQLVERLPTVVAVDDIVMATGALGEISDQRLAGNEPAIADQETPTAEIDSATDDTSLGATTPLDESSRPLGMPDGVDAEMLSTTDATTEPRGLEAGTGEEVSTLTEASPTVDASEDLVTAEAPSSKNETLVADPGLEEVAESATTPEASGASNALADLGSLLPPAALGILAMLSRPENLALAGGGALLALLLLLILVRRAVLRRRAREEATEVTIRKPALARAPAGKKVEHSPPETKEQAPELPNPLKQADVLVAVGNFEEAVRVLTDAIVENPDDDALVFKRLEVDYARRNAESFAAHAEKYQTRLELGGLWANVVAMGVVICPEHRLFALDGRAEPLESVSEPSHPETTPDEDLSDRIEPKTDPSLLADYHEDSGRTEPSLDEPRQDVAETQALEFDANVAPARDMPADLDLDTRAETDEPAPPVSKVPPTTAAHDGLETDMSSPSFEQPELDDSIVPDESFDLDETTQFFAPIEGVVEESEEEMGAALEAEFEKLELEGLGDIGERADAAGTMPEELADLTWSEPSNRSVDEEEQTGLAPSPPELAVRSDEAEPPEEASFVATKLDLAAAYLELGDDAGARTLYEEVLSEGDEMQRRLADEALRKLA